MPRRILFCIGLGLLLAGSLMDADPPAKTDRLAGPALQPDEPDEPSQQDQTQAYPPSGNPYAGEFASVSAFQQTESIQPANSPWAYITTPRGQLWRLDMAEATVEPFMDLPLIPASMRPSPVDPNILYVCTGRLRGQHYASYEKVGLYQVNLESRILLTLVDQVPVDVPVASEATLYRPGQLPAYTPQQSAEQSARALAFCNDLEVSADGKRLYFTEPFAVTDLTLGSDKETNQLRPSRNGKLWMYDLAKENLNLMAQGFNTLEGTVPEPDDETEASLIVSETINMATGQQNPAANAGKTETVMKETLALPLFKQAQNREYRVPLSLLK